LEEERGNGCHQTGGPKYSWVVYAGASFINSGAMENVTWEVDQLLSITGEVLFTYEYSFDLPSKWSAGIQLDVARALTSKLQVLAHAGYNSFSYKIDRTSPQRGIDYTERLSTKCADMHGFDPPSARCEPVAATGWRMEEYATPPCKIRA
jgi:hypothetical protein